MNSSQKALLKKTYNNPLTGYTGANKLYQQVKSKGITMKQVKEFLKKQEIYQRTVKTHTNTNGFIPLYPLYEFQIDLVYLEDRHMNKNSKYALTSIDIFTKVGDVEPIIGARTGTNVAKAMKAILERRGIPENIYSDKGSEFVAKEFKDLLKQNKIKQIFALNHAPFVERFSRLHHIKPRVQILSATLFFNCIYTNVIDTIIYV